MTDSRETLVGVFTTLGKELQEKYNFSEQDLLALITRNETIPATAFANKLTPFETACRYLAERNSTVQDIARTLKRPPSVIERTLENAKQKQPHSLHVTPTPYTVPISLLADKTKSPATNLYQYLSNTYQLSQTDIARLLNINSRTVWTVLYRMKRGESK